MDSHLSVQFLTNIFKTFNWKEYTATDSFHVAEEICKQDPDLYMASLHVDSLFTIIPMDKTIDICIISFHNVNENTTKIPENVFLYLLNIVTKDSFFMFSYKLYKQIEGESLGSPLGPALANIFVCSFENNWLKDCTHGLKPVFYRWYVEDTLYCFPFTIMLESLKSKSPNINLLLEKENDGRFCFLDIIFF